MPRPELRPDRQSSRRSLTDVRAGTKNEELREGRQGTGLTLTLKMQGSGSMEKITGTILPLSQWILRGKLRPEMKIKSLSTHPRVFGMSALC